MNKRQAWNINALFALFIFGFTIATIIKPQTGFSPRENRVLKKMPEVSADTVLSGEFESDYEEYLSDQFILRDRWITLRTLTQRLMLHSDVHGVYFGADDYLIEKHDGIFETDQAAANLELLADFAAKAEEKYPGHVTVMMIPNAVDILRDKLPLFAAPYDEEMYIGALKEKLPAGVFYDAGAELLQHTDEQLYYRTDHHWTTDAAFHVFAGWMSERAIDIVGKDQYTVTEVTDAFEGTVASKTGSPVRPDPIRIYQKKDGAAVALIYNQTDDVRHTVYQMDLLEERDKYSVFYGGNYGLIEAETTAGTGRRMLVIKDSYAHCFVPFLYDYFDEVDMIDLRYFNQSLEKYMEDGLYTDILVLQNAAGFAEDLSLTKLLA